MPAAAAGATAAAPLLGADGASVRRGVDAPHSWPCLAPCHYRRHAKSFLLSGNSLPLGEQQMRLELDGATQRAVLTLAGPDHVWFGVGFGGALFPPPNRARFA